MFRQLPDWVIQRSREAMQNGTDESFNGKFRDEHLGPQWFRNRVEARVSIEQWRQHYNAVRPHSSLGYLTPLEFKASGAPRSLRGAHQEEQERRAEEPDVNHYAEQRHSPVVPGSKKAGRSVPFGCQAIGELTRSDPRLEPYRFRVVV
jgi:hypothetical protein